MADQKILLVDDDAEFVDVVKMVLESGGYDVVTAGGGQEGKEKAGAEAPDLIILDVMMETDSEGFKVARWLREQDDSAQTPIIMLTAVNQKYPMGFEPDEVWLPVDKFVEKPVEPQELLEEVSDSLGE